MKKIYVFQFLVILGLFLGGCASYISPPDFIPYTSYSSNPPPAYFPCSRGTYYSNQSRGYVKEFHQEPVRLRRVDNSNVVVYSNRDWWWEGNQKKWIPTGGGWYPQPGEICY